MVRYLRTRVNSRDNVAGAKNFKIAIRFAIERFCAKNVAKYMLPESFRVEICPTIGWQTALETLNTLKTGLHFL